MSASQDFVTAATPRGAALVPGGATFRVWAPGALSVHVALDGVAGYEPSPQDELVKDPVTGDWTGYFPGVQDGTKYRFYVAGPGGSGFKRDPRARELELHGYPDCDSVVCDVAAFRWHDAGFQPPAFADLVVYQLHIGVFYAVDPQGVDIRGDRVAKFLDAVGRIEYLADLGVTAVQPLPVVEYQGEWSLGYNGTDLFSPEMDYGVDEQHLGPYLDSVNALLAKKGHGPVTRAELAGQANQLRMFVDLCHLYGIAVIVDVVYNHAGGGLDAQSIDYFDFPAQRDAEHNLYFSAAEWAGGRVFDYARPEVRDFLIDNALMFLAEYHVDGFRFDEVSVIDATGGWAFCQELTARLRAAKPTAVLIAEYWAEHRWLAVWRPPAGMGFDVGYTDGMRDGVRRVLADASGGAMWAVHLDPLARALGRPWHVPGAWQSYHCLENHDLVLDADGDHRYPRIARLADPSNPRSWHARSRARVAAALLLTAPGIPMLFMGQEFLEDKLWSDDPHRDELGVWWGGLEGGDRHMSDHHRCTRDLVWLRRRQPALRGEAVHAYHVDAHNRVLAFHRWVPGVGRDVVVVVSLAETSFVDGYALGFPQPGHWHEVFNSDVYDHFPNPWAQGNGGRIAADGPPLHGLDHSADVTLPATSVLVFARDRRD